MMQLLPGFRDFYPEDCFLRNEIFQHFRRVAHTFGFEEFDAPTLESLELFTTKSGPEIVEQLFHFSDKGGRSVALRPEMTPSLARMVGAKAAALKKPVRWFNIAENFRYERPQKGRLRSFYQMNVDLLGEASTYADAEVITLLIEVLKSFGLTQKDFRIRLSDRKLWVLFLEGLGIESALFGEILQIIDKIEREREEVILEKLRAVLGDKAQTVMQGIQTLKNCRSLEALSAFFSSQASETAMQRLQDWQVLLSHFEALGLEEFIQIDLSIVRGLAYYTGFVFEAFECTGESRAIAGGGRYDELVLKLTGNPLCAVGFAIGDVTLGNLLREKGLLSTYQPSPEVFMVFEESTRASALELVSKLRSQGIRVVYDLTVSASFSKQLKQANKLGAHWALILGPDEVQQGNVAVKNLATGDSEVVSREELLRRYSAR